MNPSRTVILVAGAGLLAVLLSFPPFFGIDTTSNGRVHADIGHHPRWRPPSPEQVLRAVSARRGAAARGAAVPGPAGSPDPAAYQARLNVVRLASEALLVLAGTGLALLVTGRRTPRGA